MGTLLDNLLIAVILLLTISSKGSSRSRLILFNILVFMTMAGLQLEVPLIGSGMRSYLAFLLLIVSDKAVVQAINWLKATRILMPFLTLMIYIMASHVILSGVFSAKTLFEQVGNFGFFLLIVATLLNSSNRQIVWFLISMGSGLLLNILAYLPSWMPMMSGVTLFGAIPHYQLPASSGLLLLPLVLMLYHSQKKIRGRIFAFLALAFITVATFITGARTPTAAYVIILAFYRRKIRWTLAVILMGIIAFSLMPETTQTERMVSRIQQLSLAARTGTLQENPDAGMRMENVRIALEGISERPLFGWGIDSWIYFRQLRTGTMEYVLAAHSGFILLLFETGLVGVAVYFFFIASCLSGLKMKMTGSLLNDIGYVAILGTAALLIMSIGGDSLLKRGTFSFFGLGAYCKSAKLRELYLSRIKAAGKV